MICINKLIDTDRYRSIHYNDNLRFVMALKPLEEEKDRPTIYSIFWVYLQVNHLFIKEYMKLNYILKKQKMLSKNLLKNPLRNKS